MGGRRSAWAAAAAFAVGLATATGAAAETVTFGADLSQAPTNTVTCGQGYAPFYPFNPSCTYFSGAPGPSFYAPVSGTVSAVRVRVGPLTGPMQVLVMRSLYQNKAGDPGHPYFACCFVERYGPVFTPAANTVTTEPVDLSMTEEPVPPPEDFTTNAAGDFLALSVLSPEVPIPIVVDNASYVSGFYPAVTEAVTPAPSPNPVFQATDLPYGRLAMSADLQTGGGGGGAGPGPAPAPGPGATAAPRLALPAGVPLRGGTASFPVQCLVVDCRGTLNLANRRLAGAAAARSVRTVSYGTASFALKAGHKGSVKVKLSRAGRALLAHGRRRASVWANVTYATGGAPSSTRVTLRRP